MLTCPQRTSPVFAPEPAGDAETVTQSKGFTRVDDMRIKSVSNVLMGCGGGMGRHEVGSDGGGQGVGAGYMFVEGIALPDGAGFDRATGGRGFVERGDEFNGAARFGAADQRRATGLIVGHHGPELGGLLGDRISRDRPKSLGFLCIHLVQRLESPFIPVQIVDGPLGPRRSLLEIEAQEGAFMRAQN